MKAITIRQPWASLIVLGAKRIETRSWKTNYRGAIAIHASAKFHPGDHQTAMTDPDMRPWLSSIGVGNLPLGAVIATATLVDCVSTNDSGWMQTTVSDCNEWAFGDFSAYRYGWMLEDVTPIEPVPAKGQLGLWEWEER